MRTREKIRIVNAFKGGKSFYECFALFECAKSTKDIEDAIRWGLLQRFIKSKAK